MTKFYESSAVFQYNWQQVAQAFWNRYPNPYSTHVLNEDTIFREVKGNKLVSKRLISKTGIVPKWAERFVNASNYNVIEESVIDLNDKTITTYTRNVGLTRVLAVIEKVVYRVSDENPNWTIAVRSGWIDSQLPGVKNAFAAYGLKKFKKSCDRMVLGFNHILSHMYPHRGNTDSSAVSIEKSSVQEAKEKLKDAAKRASSLAMSKATPIVATCQDR